jgi:beta-glucosidase
LIREKAPETKILLLGCFPFGAHPSENSRGKVLIQTNRLISRFADRRHVFFLNINHVFLKPDGSLDKALLPDYLHPNPAGALLWAKAMDPLLTKLMAN